MQSPAPSELDYSGVNQSSSTTSSSGGIRSDPPSSMTLISNDNSNSNFMFDNDSSSLTPQCQSQPRRGSLPTDLANDVNSHSDSGNITSSSVTPAGASASSHNDDLMSTTASRRTGIANGHRRGSGDSATNNHRSADISSQLRFPRSIMITHVDDAVFDELNGKARFAQMFKEIDPECTVLFFKTFNRVRVDFTHHQAAASARKMVTNHTENNLASLAGRCNGHAPSLADAQRSQSTDTILGGTNGNSSNQERFLTTSNMKCIWFFNIVKEMNLDSTLKPPKLEKQFLISPPASPPVDWEPAPEHEPIISYDVLSAIAELDPGQAHELHPSGGDEHPSIVFHPCPDVDATEGNNTDADDANSELCSSEDPGCDDAEAAENEGTLRRRTETSGGRPQRRLSADNYDDGGSSNAGSVVTAHDAVAEGRQQHVGKRTRRRFRIKIVSEDSYNLERADSLSDDHDETASNASSASSSPSRRRNVAMRIGNSRVIPHTRRPPLSEGDASHHEPPSS